MPNLNGYGTLAALCDDPDTFVIPVIYLTAETVWTNIAVWIVDGKTELPSGALAAGEIEFSRPAN